MDAAQVMHLVRVRGRGRAGVRVRVRGRSRVGRSAGRAPLRLGRSARSQHSPGRMMQRWLGLGGTGRG